MAVTFVGEAEIEPAEEEVAPLAGELAELAALDCTALDPFAHRLGERLRAGRVDLEGIEPFETMALIRALDHVQNANQLGRQGQRLRDVYLTDRRIPYRLRPSNGGVELHFTSHFGAYSPGDRLVRSPGEAYRVTDEIVEGDAPNVLVIDEWRKPLATD